MPAIWDALCASRKELRSSDIMVVDGSAVADLCACICKLTGTCEEAELRAMNPMLNTMIWPVLMTLCFMHCNNVLVERRKASRVISMIAKKDRLPQDYHVLRLEPLRRVTRREGGENCGAQKALHIARGHFARYDERPLFGKYKGVFWVPAHVRGGADRVVSKEYRLDL